MTKEATNRAIIIGAGIAGIATAIRLSAKGYQVFVFEANAYPGGKLSSFELHGYRFDAGPSLFTMPQFVEELLEIAGKNPASTFPYLKLEKGCHYFYEDGTKLIAYHNINRFKEEIHEKLGIDPNPIEAYLEKAKFRYQTTAPLFLEKSLHKIDSYLRKETIKGIINMPKLNLFEPMNAENERVLNHPHLVQYFNRFATYNGSNPYEAPALLNMIPHLEHNIGTFFPINGMHQITQTLYQTALDMGVTFNFNAKVDLVQTEKNSVTGILCNNQFHAANLVVSNMDIYPTYKFLLKQHVAPTKILNQEKSSSAIIFYWGIQKTFDQLDLHNIFFSADYASEFKAIFKEKRLFNDPTIYINITSKYKKDDAPAGCENWFVMINTPPHTNQNWEKIAAEAKQNILQKLSRMLGEDIAPLIACEEILDPQKIELKTSSHGGSLYGNASNNRYAAFLRHANFHSDIKGLFFCGGSVHPGGGIPLCLQSAKIVSELIPEPNRV
jgi:phytoene desaturase